MIVTWTGEDGSVWKAIARSNEAFCKSTKGLNFSSSPPRSVSSLKINVAIPFLSKEVLPFNVKVRR